jgi:ATP-dependent Lon protease
LGDVIKESAHIAVSWVKANAYALKLTETHRQILLPDMDLHLHLPNGAVPKDGPSAGNVEIPPIHRYDSPMLLTHTLFSFFL